MSRFSRSQKRTRRGNVVVLTALMITMIIAVLASAIDLGYLFVARTEMQRTADSSALAAAWELIDEEALTGDSSMTLAAAHARDQAYDFAFANDVTKKSPKVELNSSNSPDGDVVLGTISDLSDPDCPMTFDDPASYNAIKVRVRKTSQMNGEVAYFFAKAMGYTSLPMEADATAGVLRNFGGFKAPGNGSGNLEMLPFALDIDTWNNLKAGLTDDDWYWDASDKSIRAGADGVREVNLYPQGTGSPGNRGTVDIGSSNNSTNDISRQIVDGISEADLEYHDGELAFDDNGELELNGDTGISAGVKDELASIKGQPRIIPIFQSVSGPGNNAQYVIVQFAGIRIMDVKLTGPMTGKRVIIQPANIVSSGALPYDGEEQKSFFVYSKPVLIR